MAGPVIAVRDPTLTARVLRRWPLMYSAGADPAIDRPAHVRAGSGLAWVGERLVVVQDDAQFLAIIEPTRGTVESIALPVGHGGLRQFDDLRQNKPWKLDLETCTTIEEDGHLLLLAMGSGSTSWREQILMIPWPKPEPRDMRLFHAPAFYSALRQHVPFAGSELNIEGAVYLGGDVLRLLQRGNGAACEGCPPVNAVCDVSWKRLRAHLNDPAAPVPMPENVIQYELGTLEGVRLSFTDAVVRRGSVYFTATAEASSDAVCDGPVSGSVIGRFCADGSPRWTVLLDADGNRLCEKVEGIVFDAAAEDRGWVLIDHDDPGTPSELCEIVLDGPWIATEPFTSWR